MRKRKEIEKEVGGPRAHHYGHEYEQITIEILLDIRELLLKEAN